MTLSRSLLTTALLLWGAHKAESAARTENFTVKRGQSASYIAFLKYGMYNDSIAGFLKADNPSVTNLDELEIGQVLKLRVPENKSEATKPSDPSRRVQLASRKAVVTIVRGVAQVTHPDGKTEALRVNQFLATGDRITTGANSFAELIIDNQSVLRLSQSTEVKLTAIQEPRLAASKDTRPLYTRISLLRGQTWSKVQKWAGKLVHYQVQLPSAIAGVHGTVFESSVAEDSTGSVTVRQGEVSVEGFVRPEGTANSSTPSTLKGANEVSLGQWVEVLRAGMRIDVSKTGKPTKPRTVENTTDNWKRLNDERECICD